MKCLIILDKNISTKANKKYGNINDEYTKKTVYEPIWEILSRKSKKFRMILTYIISDILKIEDKSIVTEIACLIETLHNCSLIIGNLFFQI